MIELEYKIALTITEKGKNDLFDNWAIQKLKPNKADKYDLISFFEEAN